MKIKFTKLIALVLAIVTLISVTACQGPAHTHEWGEWQVGKAGSCIEKATKIRYCKLDQTHFEEEETGFGEHDWADWQTIEQAECNKEGKEKRVCKLDDTHVEEQTIASGHVGAGDWITDETGHWKKCSKCSEKCDFSEHKSDKPATTSAPELCATCGYEIRPIVNLNNKKIIFIGNSFTYYGNLVYPRTSTSYPGLNGRTNDKENFYKLCKSKGAEVKVTNWTMDGHGLQDTLGNSCGATGKACIGQNHYANLTDRNYDYVVFQAGTRNSTWTPEQFVEQIHGFMKDFKNANPKTQFILLIQSQAHIASYTWLPAAKVLEQEGVIIVDWGKIVYDVMNGTTQVPGSTMTYNKNSFIVAKSEEDGYHPNILSGYITCLMTYCAITGEVAVGSEYEFCHVETSTKYQRNLDLYYNQFYKVGTSNFREVMRSANEMKGIQQLIDQHLATKPYLNY